MKRPSGAFVVAMGLLAAAGGAGAWTWHKANSVPATVCAKGEFWESVRHREPRKIPPPTREELARLRELALETKARMIAKYPLLAVEMHPVPDEENAFRLLYQLGQEFGDHQVTISPQLKKLLECPDLPDVETANAALAENADFISRIERIAALKTRSSANMPKDYVGFVSGVACKTASDVFLFKARLAARDGDREETFRLVAATRNLADHYHQLETPNLLTETLTILLDLGVRTSAFKHLVPEFHEPADLERWQDLLKADGYSPADFAHVLRGEWHSTNQLIFSTINPRSPDSPPDPEALAEVFARAYSDKIAGLTRAGADFGSLASCADMMPGDHPELSPQSRKITEIFSVGSGAWGKGYSRAATFAHQSQAAIELLRLEQAGTPLDPALCATVTRDPVTGQPFVLNPATRELSAPFGADPDIKPLALPR
ncbi:MAG: hypothetical protein J0M04_19360 [Verrucomicrobia bacterium]|nr:hypothetical protein [Verrucomicrobiota bacterium]